MSKLTLQYRYDSSFSDPRQTKDDFGRLSILVDTDRISCKGGFWVQWQDVQEFNKALNVFPISAAQPIVGQWGFNMQEGDDLILRMQFSPANKRGDILVRFEVADDCQPEDRARGRFLTDYQSLKDFSDGISRLMDREMSEAVFIGQ